MSNGTDNTLPDLNELNEYFWEVLEALLEAHSKRALSADALRHHLSTLHIKTAEEWFGIWRKVPVEDKQQNALWISVGLACWDVVVRNEWTAGDGRWQDAIYEYVGNYVQDASSFVVFRRHYYAFEKLNITALIYEDYEDDEDQPPLDVFLRKAYSHEVCYARQRTVAKRSPMENTHNPNSHSNSNYLQA
jgi:hypothetical protein